MQSYTVYQEPEILRQMELLHPAKISRCQKCCNISGLFLSYFLVAYMSADAALLSCFKTNCTLPHNINITNLNGSIITLQNEQIIEFLSTSEGVAGLLLALIVFYKFIYCLCRNTC